MSNGRSAERSPSRRSVGGLGLLHGLGERREDLEGVAHDAVVRDLEDRGRRVLVDRDDHLGCAHAGEVLDRP